MHKFSLISAAIASLILTASAHAGYRDYSTVSINNANRAAGGNLRAIANSANSVEYLFCAGYPKSGGVYCVAKDASGNAASCSAIDATMAATASAAGGNVYLSFTWDASGTCTAVNATAGSAYR